MTTPQVVWHVDGTDEIFNLKTHPKRDTWQEFALDLANEWLADDSELISDYFESLDGLNIKDRGLITELIDNILGGFVFYRDLIGNDLLYRVAQQNDTCTEMFRDEDFECWEDFRERHWGYFDLREQAVIDKYGEKGRQYLLTGDKYLPEMIFAEIDAYAFRIGASWRRRNTT